MAEGSAAGQLGGEDYAIGTQGRGWNAVCFIGFAKCGGHDGAGDAAVRGDRDRVAVRSRRSRPDMYDSHYTRIQRGATRTSC